MPVKRKNKTKPEIIDDVKQKAEAIRKRKVIKDKLHPFLVDKSTSVDNAKMLCMVVSMTIQQMFTNQMLKMKVSDLKLESTAEENDIYNQLMNIVKGESITDACAMLDGMGEQITAALTRDSKKSLLKDLDLELYED